MTAAGAAIATVGVATGIAGIVTELVEQGVTQGYMDDNEKEHNEAAHCVSSIAKLAIALEESTEQATKFMATQSWSNTLTTLGDMTSVKLEDNIKLILEAHMEAYSAVNRTIGPE